MAEVIFDVAPATPRKRTHDDCIVVNMDSPANFNSKSSLTEQQSTSTRASPAPSSASSLTDLTSTNDAPSSAGKPSPSSTTVPPTKKRKLGFIEKEAEKAVRAREKEEKARARAEEKVRKEAEKQRKDEGKRKAAEEKESTKRAKELEKAEKQAALEAEKKEKDEKKKAKEAEKQAKEAKKAQEEAEKLKKERSQMRLGAFFGKPKPEATPPSTPDDVSERVSSRRSSIASIDMERPVLEVPKDTNGPANPEYEKWILPFYIPPLTDVAPYNRFKLSRRSNFEITADSTATAGDISEHFGRPRKRMKKTIPVKEIIYNIQASGLDFAELDSAALDALGQTSYKYLHFREDVRPPYQGTYTRLVSPRTSRKISRNPFTRGLPDKNYDYDSEAEWEPPGEDDEELNDEEMSDAEDVEDEMADFLDDEDDITRRKGPLTDMEPVSSGLCWVGGAFDDRGMNLEQYRMDFLHDSTNFPIDPFSTKHWIDELKPKAAVKAEPSASMQPPRQPLASLSPNFLAGMKPDVGIDSKTAPTPTQMKTSSNNKPLKIIEPEYMEDFKKAIDGSDLTKAGLIEILKKQFPKCSKDAIKDTLGTMAERKGKKEADKRWHLIET